jgi:hypothetical protein
MGLDFVICEDGYKNIYMATVGQAAKDYLKAKERLYDLSKSKNVDVNEDKYKKEIARIKKFFHSEMYQTMCTINGDWLIRQLDEKHIEDMKTKETKKKN